MIDFNERSEAESKLFELPWRWIEREVRPKRAEKDAARYPRMVNEWWKFWNSRPALRKAIAGLNEVLVMTRHSVTLMPCRIAKGPVASEATVVFATESYADQAVLSSSLHQMWAIKYGSGLRNDPRYTPSDVFGTFPRPEPNNALDAIGRTLDADRREVMLRRTLGLTKLYNLVNDPEITDVSDPDVARLRQLHVELDQTVMDAYGWGDVPLDHGFHTYRQMRRWTVSPFARVKIFDLLLDENHCRAALQGDVVPDPDADEVDFDSIEGDDE